MQSSSSSSASSSFAYPPGFRFVPTDAELFYYYLKPFLRDNTKACPNVPIHHANIYESNPQQLSAQYKKGNLTEWFFISERTKIKRSGKKQKRGDNSGGHWHAKAVTKKIKAGQGVVGYKATLNYFDGKQPKGVRTNWLMQEYSLESSDNNNKVDYAICKIYLSPTAKKNMKEEDVEDLEEDFVQPCSVENQQPQPQLYPTPTPLHQPQPQSQPLDSHQPQRQDDEYQEPLQPQPLNTIYHHQSQRHDIASQEPLQPQPLNTIHQWQRHDSAYQEQHQPQPPDIIIHHQSHQLHIWQATLGVHQTQLHEVAFHAPQPLDTVQDQLPQFRPAHLDSYPPHGYDIQYPQPQHLDAIEYENMIESCTQNGDSKKVDPALKIHLTPRGVKREVEEEEDEKSKRKKEGVGASKEEHEQPINSHQILVDDDPFYAGFIEPHLLDIDVESINNCCLNKSSDKD